MLLDRLDESIFESIGYPLAVVDGSLSIRRCNRSFRQVFGLGAGAKLTKAVGDGKLKTLLCRVMRTGEPLRDVEFTVPSTTGDLRHFRVAISTPAGDDKHLLLTLDDVTEWERRQMQVMEANRLVSVGRMAAGLAHEVNNPLAAIMGLAQLILRRDVDDQTQRDLRRIVAQSERAARVVADLRSFTSRRRPSREYVDVGVVLRQALELKSHQLRAGGVEVVTSIAPDLPMTMADREQIVQVFVNIITNAEQAIADRGGRGTLTIDATSTGKKVRISFSDDGVGIDPEDLPKIFDPFFTTRPVGEGIGLGLSMCYGVVSGHGGTIRATSKPGHGARIKVELPVKAARAAGPARGIAEA